MALGLGIAVNNSVFTLVNTALIRDLPFERPDELVTVRSVTNQGAGRRGMAVRELEKYRGRTTTFAGLAASVEATMTIADEDRAPERARGTFVSSNLFPLLGQTPVLGRTFRPDDDRPGAAAVVVLGDGLWRQRYGADPGIIGRPVRVNDVSATVIGVMPPGFKYPMIAQLWQPLAASPSLSDGPRPATNLNVIGRLKTGVARSAADGGSNASRRGSRPIYPDTNAGVTDFTRRSARRPRRANGPILMTIMGAVAFVLLTACANLAALLLARAAHRSPARSRSASRSARPGGASSGSCCWNASSSPSWRGPSAWHSRGSVRVCSASASTSSIPAWPTPLPTGWICR